jgi:phosphoglycerol transferase
MNPLCITSVFHRPFVRAVVAYTTAALLSLLFAGGVLKLWHANLRFPFVQAGDALCLGAAVKGTIENGWFRHNDALGAPDGLDLSDYPVPDNLHFLCIKLIGMTTRNWALTVNLYYLLTFPLTAISSLYVLRRLGVSYLAGLTIAEIYTLLPFHFLRGEMHLFLAAYYLVPLMILVILRVYLSDAILLRRTESGWQWCLRERKNWGALAICVLVASSGIYYAFFGCFFLVVAGLAASVGRRAWQPLAVAASLSAMIVFVGLLNLTPTFLYQHQHGPNLGAVHRAPSESELYGLKISQMVLPVTGHRISRLAHIKRLYNLAPCTTENDSATLGIVGTAGLLALGAWFLYRWRSGTGLHLLDGAALLTVAGVLLGTIGGLGAMLSLLVTERIRAYNRISIFLAFFCLLAVAYGLDWLGNRRMFAGSRRWAFAATVLGLLAFAVYDQTAPSFVPDYGHVKESFLRDHYFVQSIEKTVPAGTAIFQLPYMPFPESTPVHDMHDYEHFRGYLHSRSLRWSYGAMKGRPGGLWYRDMSAKPPEELLKGLALAGFGGITINRAGYEDGGTFIDNELRRLLGRDPITSADGWLLFFDISEYARRLRSTLGDDAWAEGQSSALHTVGATWGGGYHSREGVDQANWRWCSQAGELVLTNPSAEEKDVTLTMGCQAAAGRAELLHLRGPGFADNLKVDDETITPFTKTLRLPPGRTRLTFACEGQRLRSAGEQRVLYFRVMNFSLREFDHIPTICLPPEPR